MKKIIAVVLTICTSLTLQAQDTQAPYDLFQDRYMVDQVLRSVAIISVFILIAVFIITLIRNSLSYRLKSKMIDKGVSENIAYQFLQTTKKSDKTVTMKWFTILCGAGIGLLLVKVFQPYGIHSLAIMMFCISASFLGFFFYLKKSGE